jgi:hypothetical protein
MDGRAFFRLSLPGCVALVLVTGCPQPAPRENAVTWGIKAATGRLNETTPLEWQAVATKIDNRTPNVEVSLTEEQAEVIVAFVQANELDTIADVTELMEQAIQDPRILDECEVPEEAIDLFSDVDFEGFAEGFVDDLQGWLPAR